MRYVKFTPEEMAIDAADVDASKSFFIQGEDNIRRFWQWRKRLARLEPKLRKAFPTDQSVNEALRAYLKFRKTYSTRKKSA